MASITMRQVVALDMLLLCKMQLGLTLNVSKAAAVTFHAILRRILILN